MTQLTFSANNFSRHAPPLGNSAEIPILSLFKETYLLWHNFLVHLPRLTRYTLGVKIDSLFTDLIAVTLTAQYTKREEKLPLLLAINQKLDHIKYFITILWEAKGLEANQYSQLAIKLTEAGVMLGGWIRKLESMQTETPST